jgi:hypothetical protein
VNYHKALVASVGEPQADTTWLGAWNGQSIWAEDVTICKYETDFADYVNSQNLPGVTNLVSDTVVGATTAGENLIGAGTSATAALSSFFATIMTYLPYIMLVVVIALAWYFGKKYNLFSLKAA